MNKYQEALDVLKGLVLSTPILAKDFKKDFDILQELIDLFFKNTTTNYQEAIDVLSDRELDNVEKMAVKDLENLTYQYKMRLADAELLNKLRNITGTCGDLDLLSKVKERFENGKE